MSTQMKSGFTIIEVMLFLAIAGALTVGILVGSSVAIGQQRHRDSINSFKSALQRQYSTAVNVVGSETLNPNCVFSSQSLSFDLDNRRPRGTSECLVMGRFVVIDGNTMTSYNIVGRSPSGGSAAGDAAAFQNYALALQAPDVYEMSWGARIVKPQTDDSMLTSVAILRSPLSGAILTYILDGDHSSNIKEMIDDNNMKEKNFCVDSGSGLSMSSRMAVRINARAASSSAVEIPLQGSVTCG